MEHGANRIEARLCVLERLVQEGQQGIDEPGGDGGTERVLVLEVEVERPLAQLDRVRDRIHSQAVVPVDGDELLRRIENRFSPCRALPLSSRCDCQPACPCLH